MLLSWSNIVKCEWSSFFVFSSKRTCKISAFFLIFFFCSCDGLWRQVDSIVSDISVNGKWSLIFNMYIIYMHNNMFLLFYNSFLKCMMIWLRVDQSWIFLFWSFFRVHEYELALFLWSFISLRFMISIDVICSLHW